MATSDAMPGTTAYLCRPRERLGKRRTHARRVALGPHFHLLMELGSQWRMWYPCGELVLLEMIALTGAYSVLDRRVSRTDVVIPLASNRFQEGLDQRGNHNMRSGNGAIAHPPLAYKAHLITRSEHRVDLDRCSVPILPAVPFMAIADAA